IKQIKFYFCNNPFTYKTQKDVIIFNHQRRIKDDNFYVCLYTSDLIKNLGKDAVVFETPYQETHYTPVPEKDILYTDSIINYYFLVRLKNKLLRRKYLSNEDYVI